MIPRPFDFERPTSVGEAVEMLAGGREAGLDTKVIAGGQSLVPMLSLGLVRPALVVDVNRLDLEGIDCEDGVVRVGALTRHRTLELSAEVREVLPLAAEAARHIGNPRVRNRGTFGGSLGHADPAAELPVVALIHDGFVVTQAPAGERRIPLADFFHSYFETALEQDELLVRVDLNALPSETGVGFHEEAARADDFALACAAAAVRLEDGVCTDARLAIGGVGDVPTRVTEAENVVRGERLSETMLEHLAAVVEAAVHPEEDPFCSAAFRQKLAGVCSRRAVTAAWGRAGQ